MMGDQGNMRSKKFQRKDAKTQRKKGNQSPNVCIQKLTVARRDSIFASLRLCV